MFDRIKSYFSKASENTENTVHLPDVENHQFNGKNQSNSKTWVFIWNTTPKTVGHAAMQLNGDSPKITEDQPGEYVSLHPQYPAIGPTTVLPLPSELATTLDEDMKSEGASMFNKNIDMDVLNLDSTTSSLPPDQIFEIDGLDTKAMHDEIHKYEEKIDKGDAYYQLLPNVNTLGYLSSFLQDASTFINYDPIDIASNKNCLFKNKNRDLIHPNNCATLVGDILNKGGMDIHESNTPWGLTPNELAEQIHDFESKSKNKM